MDAIMKNMVDRNITFVVQDKGNQETIHGEVNYMDLTHVSNEDLTTEDRKVITYGSGIKFKKDIKCQENEYKVNDKTISIESKEGIIYVKANNLSENHFLREMNKDTNYKNFSDDIHVLGTIVKEKMENEELDYPSKIPKSDTKEGNNHVNRHQTSCDNLVSEVKKYYPIFGNNHIKHDKDKDEFKIEENEYPGCYNSLKSEIKEGIMIKEKGDKICQDCHFRAVKEETSCGHMDVECIAAHQVKLEIKSGEVNLSDFIKIPKNEIKEERIYKKDDNLNNDFVTSFTVSEAMEKMIDKYERPTSNVHGPGIKKIFDEFNCKVETITDKTDKNITELDSTCESDKETMKEISDNCFIMLKRYKVYDNPVEENCKVFVSSETECDFSPLSSPLSNNDRYEDKKLLQKPIVLLVDLKYNNVSSYKTQAASSTGINCGSVDEITSDDDELPQRTECSNVTEFNFNIDKESVDENGFFKCSLCTFKSVYKWSLINHWLVHTNKRSFQCNQCEYKAKRKCDLKEHILRHDLTYTYNCNFCSYKGKKKEYFTIHMLKHTNPDLFRCSICDKGFTTKPNLLQHQQFTHNESKDMFNCELCNFTNKRKSSVTHHMNTVHEKKQIFNCTSCSYSTARKGDLSRHMMAHTGIKPYGCSQCSFKCTNSGTLNSHMRTHTGERPFTCTLCDKSFKMKGTLNEHMDTHKESKAFQCSKCDYACNSKKQLKNHTISHTGKKPYKCSSCNYRSKTRGCLKEHMKIHSGKFLNCKLCDYKTPFMLNMRSHMNTHEGIKPFKCDMCDYAGRSKQHLEHHLENEHEYKSKKIYKPKDRNFPCDMCSFVAASFGYLRNHLKTVHGILNF